MNKNEVNLKDIIWVIGYKEKDGKKIFKAIPYVIKSTVKGYEDLVDLTESWATCYNGKVTNEVIIKKFESVHNAKAVKVIISEDAIKQYILIHENVFKNQIEKLIALDINQAIKNYCEIKVLNIQEGSDLISEMKKGVKTRYNQIKEKAENIKDDFIENNL